MEDQNWRREPHGSSFSSFQGLLYRGKDTTCVALGAEISRDVNCSIDFSSRPAPHGSCLLYVFFHTVCLQHVLNKLITFFAYAG